MWAWTLLVYGETKSEWASRVGFLHRGGPRVVGKRTWPWSRKSELLHGISVHQCPQRVPGNIASMLRPANAVLRYGFEGCRCNTTTLVLGSY